MSEELIPVRRGIRGSATIGYVGLLVLSAIVALAVVRAMVDTQERSRPAEDRYLHRVAGWPNP